MSQTKDFLVEMLYEERRAREDAQNILNVELRRLELDREDDERRKKDLQDELEIAQENVQYQITRNDRLVRDNDELRQQINDLEYKVTRTIEPWDYKSVALRMVREYLVREIAEKNPQFLDTIEDVPGGRFANKIAFIKEVREQSGLGLKESKDIVDEYLEHQRFVADVVADMMGSAITFEPEDHDFEATK